MPIKIHNTANLSNKDGVKVIVYGGAGVGKTRLCITAPRPIVLSAEKGLLSVKKEHLDYIQISSYKDLEEAATWALTSKEANKYDTYCLDSISEIAEVVISDEQEKSKDPRKIYPQYQKQMMDIFRAFRDMPCKHIYFIAKETATKDALGSITYGPSFPGNKLPEAAPYFFDEVFRLVTYTDPNTKLISNALKTRKDETSEGKDRSGMLDFWEPPNLAYVFNKIMKA